MTDEEMKEKHLRRCYHCGKIMSEDNFYYDKSRKNYRRICKKCHNETCHAREKAKEQAIEDQKIPENRYRNKVAVLMVFRPLREMQEKCECICGQHFSNIERFGAHKKYCEAYQKYVESLNEQLENLNALPFYTEDTLVGRYIGGWLVYEDAGNNKEGEHLFKCICKKCGYTQNITETLLKERCGAEEPIPCPDCSREIVVAGDKFGNLVVRRVDGAFSTVECICGKVMKVPTVVLSSGQMLSCGCSDPRNLTGKRFGSLVVQKRADKDEIDKDGKHIGVWSCVCDCGRTTTVSANKLISRRVTHCGCANGSIQKKEEAEQRHLSVLQKKFGLLDEMSGYYGISFDPKTECWLAVMPVNGKTKILCTSPSLSEALTARLQAEAERFGIDAPQAFLFEKYKIKVKNA